MCREGLHDDVARKPTLDVYKDCLLRKVKSRKEIDICVLVEPCRSTESQFVCCVSPTIIGHQSSPCCACKVTQAVRNAVVDDTLFRECWHGICAL